MICGNCRQKVSDIELYCKVCGADLQISSSEKKSFTTTSEEIETSPPAVSIQNETKLQPPHPSPDIDISVPSFLSNPSPPREEKPLYDRYFLDKEEK